MNKRKASTLSEYRLNRQKNLRRYQTDSYRSENRRRGGHDFSAKRADEQPNAFPFLKLPTGKPNIKKINPSVAVGFIFL